MPIIRTMRKTDIHFIMDIGTQIFREEDEIPLLKKALYLCVPDLSYVVLEDTNIIGFTLVCKKMTNIYYHFMNKIPNCYELAFFGIIPTHQGRGLGSQLLKKTLLSIFQKSRTFTCWLLVDTINTSAISMYERFGFRHWNKIVNKVTLFPSYIMGLSYRRYK